MNDQPPAANPTPAPPPPEPPPRRRSIAPFVVALVAFAIVTFAILWLLTNIWDRKQEAKNPYVRLVEVDETTTDPEVWARNWPRQYDAYIRTVDLTHTRYGGSEAITNQKLDRDPWLKLMFSGYAFALDYRDRRGHAYMLSDQEETERVTERPQPGACLHCHASVVPTWRRLGMTELNGKEPTAQEIASDFNWPAVMKGFELMSTMRYVDAHRELMLTPDGTPESNRASDERIHATGAAPTTQQIIEAHAGHAHPISCVDCHDPRSMELRVTRPGFVHGIQALANSDDPLPHLPSVERWRSGNRAQVYDPNRDASRQEMRSFVCAQCHVEYYCGPKDTLFFPWHNGLKVEQIEQTFEQHTFPDGTPFNDWTHGITGGKMFKAQHPEFEMWSQGVHARAGVSCADCHMPYQRQGAMKVSDHWVRSPLLMINRSCQPCHSVPEDELLARVYNIQDKTRAQIDKAAEALVDMIDAIVAAKSGGATDEQLKPAIDLQRKAQWRLDYVYAENSMGFHASQEVMRILADATDFARQGQIAANRLRLQPVESPTDVPAEPVQGVTPTERAPTATPMPGERQAP